MSQRRSMDVGSPHNVPGHRRWASRDVGGCDPSAQMPNPNCPSKYCFSFGVAYSPARSPNGVWGLKILNAEPPQDIYITRRVLLTQDLSLILSKCKRLIHELPSTQYKPISESSKLQQYQMGSTATFLLLFILLFSLMLQNWNVSLLVLVPSARNTGLC